MFTDFEIELMEDFSDPVVFLKCFYVTNESSTHLSLIFSHFRKFMLQNYPIEEAYIDKIRLGISGYGTKEDIIVATLQSENFPFEKYITAYWESHFDWVEAEIERKKNTYLTNIQEDNKLQKQAAKIVENLKPHNPVKQSELLDELEQAVVTHLVEKFPELLNADAATILEFKNILSKHIPNLGMSMVNHINKIRNS